MNVDTEMHKKATWVAPDTSVSELARLMKEHDIGSIPIGENDRLVGMVTDRDIALRAFTNGHNPADLVARDVMTAGIVYCHTTDTIEDAVRIMESNKIRRLPVIDQNKRMVGMLAVGDIAYAGGQQLAGELMRSVSQHHG